MHARVQLRLRGENATGSSATNRDDTHEALPGCCPNHPHTHTRTHTHTRSTDEAAPACLPACSERAKRGQRKIACVRACVRPYVRACVRGGCAIIRNRCLEKGVEEVLKNLGLWQCVSFSRQQSLHEFIHGRPAAGEGLQDAMMKTHPRHKTNNRRFQNMMLTRVCAVLVLPATVFVFLSATTTAAAAAATSTATTTTNRYRDRSCGGYSGGNRRKLALGIALIGNPAVIFLDEPSTGMDPLTRRHMWDVITSRLSRSCIVLTSHSMEECEALCSRVGIMAPGGLRCVGGLQHLKNRYGQGCVRGNQGCVRSQGCMWGSQGCARGRAGGGEGERVTDCLLFCARAGRCARRLCDRCAGHVSAADLLVVHPSWGNE